MAALGKMSKNWLQKSRIPENVNLDGDSPEVLAALLEANPHLRQMMAEVMEQRGRVNARSTFLTRLT